MNEKSVSTGTVDTVVLFDRTALLAERVVRWMRLPGRPNTWEAKWFGPGHFLPFLPGNEAEIDAAIALLIHDGRVRVHPVLQFIALPDNPIGKIVEGAAND